MSKDDEDNGYPRVLDAKGCLYGRQYLKERVDAMDERTNKIEARLGKLTTALWGAAISFSVTAVLLALNLILP